MRINSLTLLVCLLIGCQTELSLDPSSDLGLPHPTENGPMGTDPNPLVLLGQKEYTEATVRSSVPDTALFRAFCSAYLNEYTDSLKQFLVGDIGLRTELAGGNRAEMQKCLEATGQLKNGLVSLPFFAERARYQGKDAWLFQFTWGFTPGGLGHYRCYVMGAASADTLLFITCR